MAKKNKYPVLGVIQVQHKGCTDEASEYILKSTINQLPMIGIFASIAPVPGSLVVQYQDEDMPTDPPKNEHYWHDTQATASLYKSWLITLSGSAEGNTQKNAAKSVREYIEDLAHEFYIESLCVRIGEFTPAIFADEKPFQELHAEYPTKISKTIDEMVEGKI